MEVVPTSRSPVSDSKSYRIQARKSISRIGHVNPHRSSWPWISLSTLELIHPHQVVSKTVPGEQPGRLTADMVGSRYHMSQGYPNQGPRTAVGGWTVGEWMGWEYSGPSTPNSTACCFSRSSRYVSPSRIWWIRTYLIAGCYTLRVGWSGWHNPLNYA